MGRQGKKLWVLDPHQLRMSVLNEPASFDCCYVVVSDLLSDTKRPQTATCNKVGKSEVQFKALDQLMHCMELSLGSSSRTSKQHGLPEPSRPSSTTTTKKRGGERFKQEHISRGRFPLKGVYIVILHTTRVCLSILNLHAPSAHVHPNNSP